MFNTVDSDEVRKLFKYLLDPKMDEIEKEPETQQPKYLQYHLQRITQKCTQRGERGLFGLKKLF